MKAPLKLMIFEQGTPEIVEQIAGYLAEFEQHMEGETYLLVDFAYGSYQCYQFVVSNPDHGKLKKCEVKFVTLPLLSGKDFRQKSAAGSK